MTATSQSLPATATAPLSFADFPHHSFKLANGLTVIVHENRDAPRVSLNLIYQVGAKDEPPGKTGYAHLFEHLMFCGSKNLPGSFLDRLLQAGAADVNASTGHDNTTYYATVPTGSLDFLLFAESDRMGHFYECLDQARLDQQRDIVLNEKRETEAGPFGTLRNYRIGANYPERHPYSHCILGEEADIQAATLEDARAWFRTYYVPNNAVLTLAGDIDVATAREKIEHYFGHIPPGPPLRRIASWVPEVVDARRDIVQGPTPNATLNLFWNLPRYGHQDSLLLSLAASVLASGMTSRLVRRLVHEEKISSHVGASVQYASINSQFVINAVALPNQPLEKIERIIDEELQYLLDEGVDDATLARIKTEQIASFANAHQTTAAVAGLLSSSQSLLGSPDGYKHLLGMISEATSDSIQHVAWHWLTRQRYTLVVEPFNLEWKPVAAPDRTQVPAITAKTAFALPPLQRAKLANDLPLTLAERHSYPLVVVQILLPQRHVQTPPLGTIPLAILLLNESGASEHDGFAFNNATRALGATIAISEDGGAIQIALSVPRFHLGEAIALLASRLRHSTLPADAFDRHRLQMLDSLSLLPHSAEQMVAQILPGILYPAGHPYAVPGALQGTQRSLQQLTFADIEIYLKQALQGHGAEILVTGDVTLDEVIPLLNQHLADWKIETQILPRPPLSAERPQEAKAYLIDVPDSGQSTIALATLVPGIEWDDEARFALLCDIAGYGFSSRLNRTLREEKNWTYGVQGWLQNNLGARTLCLQVPVDAARSADALAEIMGAYQALRSSNPITQNELDTIRRQRLLSLNGMAEGIIELAKLLYHMRRDGRAEDYWNQYIQQLETATTEELNALAQRYLDPQHFVWLIAGEPEQIQEAIRTLQLNQIERISGTGDDIYDTPASAA